MNTRNVTWTCKVYIVFSPSVICILSFHLNLLNSDEYLPWICFKKGKDYDTLGGEISANIVDINSDKLCDEKCCYLNEMSYPINNSKALHSFHLESPNIVDFWTQMKETLQLRSNESQTLPPGRHLYLSSSSQRPPVSLLF